MRKAVLLVLATSVFLVSCGFRDSRLNPRNWFGRSEPVATAENTNPLIPRRSALARREAPDLHVPITQITELRVERTLSGAIVRAEGLSAIQGVFGARLTPVNEDDEPVDGVLAYTLDVLEPRTPRPVGPEQTRRVVVARALTTQQLLKTRVVRVTAATNARESRRR